MCASFLHIAASHEQLELVGSPLAVILAAGEWKSPAFLCYVDQQKLETDVVIAAHQDESDEE